MGSSASKAARNAGSVAAKRQYPTRIPPVPSATQPATRASAPAAAPDSPASSAGSAPYASASRDATISADGYDPQLGASLRQLGSVQPAPTMSHSSIAPATSPDAAHGANPQPVFPAPGTNPALLVLEARRRIAEQAETEAERVGRKGFEGRQFVDVMTLRRALALRDQRGMSDAQIEEALLLKTGTMAKLGPRGVVADAASGLAGAFA